MSARAPDISGWPIAAQIGMLVTIAVLPLVAALAYLIWDNADQGLKRAGEEALRLAQISALDTARIIDEAQVFLTSLHGQMEAAGDSARTNCDSLLARELAHQPRYALIFLLDAEGEVLCSSRPLRECVSCRDVLTRLLDRPVKNGIIVGEPIWGSISQRWVIPILRPSQTEGKLAHAIGASLDLERLYPLAGRTHLPKDAVTVVVDSGNTVVIRSHDPMNWIGHKIDKPELLDLIARRTGGRAEGPDGVRRQYGTAPVAGTDWTVAVGFPEAPLLAAMNREIIANLVYVAAVIALAYIFAFFASRNIVGPVRRIADTARAVASGERGRRVDPRGARELATVAVGFNRMLDTLGAQENALRENEERLALAIEIAADGIWDWDLNTGRVFFSRQFWLTLGYAEEEEFRERFHFHTALHPEDRTHTIAAQQKTLSDGALFDEIYRLVRRDGSYHWFHGRGQALFDSNGRAWRFAGAITDITPQREAQDALRRSEERWRFALEGHGDGLWEWNARSSEVFFSTQWKAMLGYADDELPNTQAMWESLLHPEDHAQVTTIMDKHLAGELPDYYAEYRLRKKDGSYLWTAALGRIMARDVGGHPLRVIGTQRDIGERKRREEEEKLRQVRLAHSNRLVLLGEMASALAHELNQPLTAIANFASVGVKRLAAPQPDVEALRDMLGMIGEQALRAGDIVWHIRDFVSKRTAKHEPVALDALVRDVLTLAEIEARSAGVSIDLRISGPLPKALADRLQIEQVLFNLIRNAIEAMAQAAGERSLVLEVSVDPEGRPLIRVCDRGQGLGGRTDEELFAPFSSTKPDGMGLGLAICRTIVEAHGGRIWSEANAQGGATFGFFLQRAEA